MSVRTPVNVLLVDDNLAKLTALSAALEGADIEIVTATSGTQALHELLGRDFAAVLLDVNMPGMDGFETATMIRSRSRSEHLPIIFVTSEALTDDFRLKGYELGAVDYILSPVLPQILRAKVAAFADIYRMRDQSKRDAEEMRKKNEEIARQNLDLVEKQAQINQLNASLEIKVRDRTMSLQDSERLLQESQRIAKLGSYVLDVSTGAWQSSPMLDELLGIDQAYAHTMEGWGALIHPEDRDHLTADFKGGACLAGKDCDEQYRIFRHNDQAERWVHEVGQIELDAQGRPLKMHGTLQDVTDYKAVLEELDAARQREREARVQQTLEKFGTASQGLQTAQAFGVQSLRETALTYFDGKVQRFAKLLDLSLEQRVLRVDHSIGVELRNLAEELGLVKAGPRDVIDIYVQALKIVSANVAIVKANAYADEGRLMVLELMGHMVTFYRRHYSGHVFGRNRKVLMAPDNQPEDKK